MKTIEIVAGPAETRVIEVHPDAANPLVNVTEYVNSIGAASPDVGGLPLYRTQNFTVTSQILANKSVELDYAPIDPLKVELVIYGGIEQRSGVDFLVSSKTLSWSQLALELLLEDGSAFSVRYTSR